MNRGITKSKLSELYPELSEALSEIESRNKKTHYWFFANYGGKYKTPAGGKRSVSLGAVIDVLNGMINLAIKHISFNIISIKI